MLKGCTKKVVFVKLTDNHIYEEAYFVVRPGITMVSAEGDFLNEAKRIISGGCTEKQYTASKQPIGNKMKTAMCFVCGAVFSATIILLFKLFGIF